MTRSISFFCMCVAAWLAPHVALAQPAAGTVFVAASGFADIRRAPTTTLLRSPNDDSSGTVPGGALALGVYLGPRLSVRAEWSLSDTLSSSRDLGIYPYAADDLVGTLLPGIVPPNSLVVPQEVTEERDVKAGFALLGYHLTAGRASIEILGGVGLVNERVTLVTELHLPRLPDIPDYRSEYTTSAHHAVAVVGADGAVSLTSHAALVPQVRLYSLNGALQIRPGLGLRWTF